MSPPGHMGRPGRRRILRDLLRGGMASVALPRFDAWLDDHGTAYADGRPLPRRFGVWAFGNGVHRQRWVPAAEGAGDDWELPEQLRPLAAVKRYVSVISGTSLPFGGRPHAAGGTVLMTGAPLGGFSDSTFTARRPSIDQLVARQIGHTTALRSIELGVDNAGPPEKGTAFHCWSHSGPQSPNPCSYDCRAVFQRLFGGGDPARAAAAARDRRSILDAVTADAGDLARTLGARDRQRLDQHLTGVRALERRLQPSPTRACAQPTPPAGALVGPTLGTDYDPRGIEVNRTMSELLAMALACDLTRVFTYQVTKPGSRVGLRALGIGLYHNITHNEPGDQPACNAAVKFFMGELAVFIETLRRVPEGAGNLLDSCAIIAASDCTHPKTHGWTDYPLLVIGRGGGRLRAGIHHRSRGEENACRVPLTLARVAGADIAEMGEGAGRTADDLPALLA